MNGELWPPRADPPAPPQHARLCLHHYSPADDSPGPVAGVHDGEAVRCGGLPHPPPGHH